MCQSSMLMSQCDAPKQCGCEIATLSSNCIASIQIFCLPERRTSSVLGGKNSKEKNVLPAFMDSFILSTTFMIAGALGGTS